jgi:murein DD-endopeptidase MepM/ murein hydrolase activator NlpD
MKKKRSPFGKIILFLIVGALTSAVYLYKAEPDFVLSRFYHLAYADRLAPVAEVMLNDAPVSFELTAQEWSIQKHNGKWYTPAASAVDPKSTDGSKPAAIALTSHDDKLLVEVGKLPEATSLKIIETSSGRTISEEPANLPELPLPKRNGSLTYELTMEWTGKDAPYKGRYVMEIPVMVSLPEEFVFSADRLTQGQLLEVDVYHADNPDDILFEQSLSDDFRWYQEDGCLRGYLPTNYNSEPSFYLIRYGVKSKGTEATKEIELTAYDYHIQYLTVDSKTEAETRNDAAYDEYHKYYTPVRNQSEPFRYYTESFILPVRGRLTTEFGETRYVNDLPTSYRHLGLDIAADEGTEVKAANRGKVVLAKALTLTGNTVMIDHGEGLFSVYHHMRTISVKSGDIVERGQKIGEVGSTGFSTGPHLHFMISYYTTNLEPGYFLVGQPITYENFKGLID